MLGLFVMQLRGNQAQPEVTPAEPAASVAAAAPAPVQQTQSEPSASVASAPAPQSASAPGPVVTPVPAPLKAASSAVTTVNIRPASSSASATSRRETAPKPIVTEKAGDFRPVPRSPVFAAPEPAASSPAAPSSKAAPASAAPAPSTEPRTANEACGGRVLFARAWCIDRQCEKPIYHNDPECVRLRDIRSNRGNSGVP
ncbi:hypothetical protein [Roseateles sp. P5_E1]